MGADGVGVGDGDWTIGVSGAGAGPDRLRPIRQGGGGDHFVKQSRVVGTAKGKGEAVADDPKGRPAVAGQGV